MEKKIERTNDYDRFKRLAGNRDVSTKRIRKIIESINKVGYITSPIIVNEKYEVIDGQGRLAALKELGLPVEYIIHPGSGIEECLSMNINQTNWSLLDYIKSYAERGLKSYKLLLDLIESYPNINTLSIIQATQTNRKSSRSIYKGELIINKDDYEKAVDRLNYVNEIIPHVKYLNGGVTHLIQALMVCYDLEAVDVDRLKERVLKQSGELRTWSSINTCLQSLEELYNKNLSYPVFIYTEYRKQLYVKLNGRVNKDAKKKSMKYQKDILQDLMD